MYVLPIREGRLMKMDFFKLITRRLSLLFSFSVQLDCVLENVEVLVSLLPLFFAHFPNFLFLFLPFIALIQWLLHLLFELLVWYSLLLLFSLHLQFYLIIILFPDYLSIFQMFLFINFFLLLPMLFLREWFLHLRLYLLQYVIVVLRCLELVKHLRMLFETYFFAVISSKCLLAYLRFFTKRQFLIIISCKLWFFLDNNFFFLFSHFNPRNCWTQSLRLDFLFPSTWRIYSSFLTWWR